jgi:hypothetical protein
VDDRAPLRLRSEIVSHGVLAFKANSPACPPKRKKQYKAMEDVLMSLECSTCITTRDTPINGFEGIILF